ncbi:MAG: hypothetical protein GF421_07780 [Candidatus Aminicenantes bacterium]|nr:hypothetical protein [Candidatus Aminicenantes bacterium]
MKKNSQKNICVILSWPSHPENIGLVARAMNNTGYRYLRLVTDQPLSKTAYQTAVHSKQVLKNAQIFSQLSEAVRDVDVVFAAVARHRKNFPSLRFEDAVEKIVGFSPETRMGLVFGNERTGLVSEELRHSNFRFSIPQVQEQPSYNLAAAVLLTLFQVFLREAPKENKPEPKPVSRRKQKECIDLIANKLEKKDFIHQGNKEHVTDMLYDLFGRLAMTEKDQKLLLAIFSK